MIGDDETDFGRMEASATNADLTGFITMNLKGGTQLSGPLISEQEHQTVKSATSHLDDNLSYSMTQSQLTTSKFDISSSLVPAATATMTD